jgi:hypothetical protein
MSTIDQVRKDLEAWRKQEALLKAEYQHKHEEVQDLESQLCRLLCPVTIGALVKQERMSKTEYWRITSHKLRNHDTEVELYGMKASKNGKVRKGRTYQWPISGPYTIVEEPTP